MVTESSRATFRRPVPLPEQEQVFVLPRKSEEQVTIRREPLDPIEAFFDTNRKIQEIDQVSKRVEEIVRPETLELLDQIQQSGIVRKGQLDSLRDLISRLEIEKQRLTSQVRILQRQVSERPSSSGQALLDQMKQRLQQVEDRLAQKETRIQELEQQVMQQTQTIRQLRSDLADILSLVTNKDSSELLKRLKLAKTQLTQLMYPFIEQSILVPKLQALKEEIQNNPSVADAIYAQYDANRELQLEELLLLKIVTETQSDQYTYIMSNEEVPAEPKEKIRVMYNLLLFLEKTYQDTRFFKDTTEKQRKYTTLIQHLNQVNQDLQNENQKLIYEQDPITQQERLELNELRTTNQILTHELLDRLKPIDEEISSKSDKVKQIKSQLHEAIVLHQYLSDHMPENRAYRIVAKHKEDADRILSLQQKLSELQNELTQMMKPAMQILDSELVAPKVQVLRTQLDSQQLTLEEVYRTLQLNPELNLSTADLLYRAAMKEIQASYIQRMNELKRELPAKLQQRYRDLMKQLVYLNQELDDLQSSYLKDHIHLLSLQNDGLVAALKLQYDTEQKVTSLRNEIIAMKEKGIESEDLETATQRLATLELELENVKRKVAEQKSGSAISDQERQELQNRNAELEQKIASLMTLQTEALAKQGSETSAAPSEDTQQLEKKIRQQSEEIRRQRDQINALQARLQSPAIKQLEDNLKQVVYLETLIRQRDQLKTQIETADEASKQTLQKQIEDKQNRLLEVAGKVKVYYEKDLTDLNRKVVNLITTIGLQVEDYRNTQRDLETIKKDRAAIQEELNSLKTYLADLQQRQKYPEREKELEQKINDLEEEMKNINTLKERFEGQLQQIQNEQTVLSEELDDYKHILSHYPFMESELELRRLAKQIAKQYKEIIEDQKLASRLDLPESEEDAIKSVVMNDPIKKEIDTALVDLFKMKSQNDSFEASEQLTTLYKRINDLAKELIEEKKKVLSLQNEKQQLIEEKKEGFASAGQCNYELDTLKKQMEGLMKVKEASLQSMGQMATQMEGQKTQQKKEIVKLEDTAASQIISSSAQIEELKRKADDLRSYSQSEQASAIEEDISRLKAEQELKILSIQKEINEKTQTIESLENELETIRYKMTNLQSNYRDLKEEYARLSSDVKTGEKDVVEKLQKEILSKTSRIEQLQNSELKLSQLRKGLKQILGDENKPDAELLVELDQRLRAQVKDISQPTIVADKDTYILREIYKIFGDQLSQQDIITKIKTDHSALIEAQKSNEKMLEMVAELNSKLQFSQQEVQMAAQSISSGLKKGEGLPGSTIPYMMTVYARCNDLITDLNLMIKIRKQPNMNVYPLRKVFSNKIDELEQTLQSLGDPDPTVKEIATRILRELNRLNINKIEGLSLSKLRDTAKTFGEYMAVLWDRVANPREFVQQMGEKVKSGVKDFSETAVTPKSQSWFNNLIDSIIGNLQEVKMSTSGSLNTRQDLVIDPPVAVSKPKEKSAYSYFKDLLFSVKGIKVEGNKDLENKWGKVWGKKVSADPNLKEKIKTMSEDDFKTLIADADSIMSPVAEAESPKAVAESPKAVAESPKADTESPKAVAESPKAVAESPKAVTESPKAVTESPKAVPESPSVVEKASEVLSGVSEQAVSKVAEAKAATSALLDRAYNTMLTYFNSSKKPSINIKLPEKNELTTDFRNMVDGLKSLSKSIGERISGWYYSEEEAVSQKASADLEQLRIYIRESIRSTKSVYGNSFENLYQYFSKVEEMRSRVKETRYRILIRMKKITDDLKTKKDIKLKDIIEYIHQFAEEDNYPLNRGSTDKIIQEYELLDIKQFNDFLKEFEQYINRELPTLREQQAGTLMDWFSKKSRQLAEAEYNLNKFIENKSAEIKKVNEEIYNKNVDEAFKKFTKDKKGTYNSFKLLTEGISFILKGYVYKMKWLKDYKERLYKKDGFEEYKKMRETERDIIRALFDFEKQSHRGELEESIKIPEIPRDPIFDLPDASASETKEGDAEEKSKKEAKKDKENFQKLKETVTRLYDKLYEPGIKLKEKRIDELQKEIVNRKASFEQEFHILKHEIQYMVREGIRYLYQPEEKKMNSWLDRFIYQMKTLRDGSQSLKNTLLKNFQIKEAEQILLQKLREETGKKEVLESINLQEELNRLHDEKTGDVKSIKERILNYISKMTEGSTKFVPSLDRILHETFFDYTSKTPSEEGYINFLLNMIRIRNNIAVDSKVKSWIDLKEKQYFNTIYKEAGQLTELLDKVRTADDKIRFWKDWRHRDYDGLYRVQNIASSTPSSSIIPPKIAASKSAKPADVTHPKPVTPSPTKPADTTSDTVSKPKEKSAYSYFKDLLFSVKGIKIEGNKDLETKWGKVWGEKTKADSSLKEKIKTMSGADFKTLISDADTKLDLFTNEPGKEDFMSLVKEANEIHKEIKKIDRLLILLNEEKKNIVDTLTEKDQPDLSDEERKEEENKQAEIDSKDIYIAANTSERDRLNVKLNELLVRINSRNKLYNFVPNQAVKGENLESILLGTTEKPKDLVSHEMYTIQALDVRDPRRKEIEDAILQYGFSPVYSLRRVSKNLLLPFDGNYPDLLKSREGMLVVFSMQESVINAIMSVRTREQMKKLAEKKEESPLYKYGYIVKMISENNYTVTGPKKTPVIRGSSVFNEIVYPIDYMINGKLSKKEMTWQQNFLNNVVKLDRKWLSKGDRQVCDGIHIANNSKDQGIIITSGSCPADLNKVQYYNDNTASVKEVNKDATAAIRRITVDQTRNTEHMYVIQDQKPDELQTGIEMYAYAPYSTEQINSFVKVKSIARETPEDPKISNDKMIWIVRDDDNLTRPFDLKDKGAPVIIPGDQHNIYLLGFLRPDIYPSTYGSNAVAVELVDALIDGKKATLGKNKVPTPVSLAPGTTEKSLYQNVLDSQAIKNAIIQSTVRIDNSGLFDFLRKKGAETGKLKKCLGFHIANNRYDKGIVISLENCNVDDLKYVEYTLPLVSKTKKVKVLKDFHPTTIKPYNALVTDYAVPTTMFSLVKDNSSLEGQKAYVYTPLTRSTDGEQFRPVILTYDNSTSTPTLKLTESISISEKENGCPVFIPYQSGKDNKILLIGLLQNEQIIQPFSTLANKIVSLESPIDNDEFNAASKIDLRVDIYPSMPDDDDPLEDEMENLQHDEQEDDQLYEEQNSNSSLLPDIENQTYESIFTDETDDRLLLPVRTTKFNNDALTYDIQRVKNYTTLIRIPYTDKTKQLWIEYTPQTMRQTMKGYDVKRLQFYLGAEGDVLLEKLSDCENNFLSTDRYLPFEQEILSRFGSILFFTKRGFWSSIAQTVSEWFRSPSEESLQLPPSIIKLYSKVDISYVITPVQKQAKEIDDALNVHFASIDRFYDSQAKPTEKIEHMVLSYIVALTRVMLTMRTILTQAQLIQFILDPTDPSDKKKFVSKDDIIKQAKQVLQIPDKNTDADFLFKKIQDNLAQMIQMGNDYRLDEDVMYMMYMFQNNMDYVKRTEYISRRNAFSTAMNNMSAIIDRLSDYIDGRIQMVRPASGTSTLRDDQGVLLTDQAKPIRDVVRNELADACEKVKAEMIEKQLEDNTRYTNQFKLDYDQLLQFAPRVILGESIVDEARLTATRNDFNSMLADLSHDLQIVGLGKEAINDEKNLQAMREAIQLVVSKHEASVKALSEPDASTKARRAIYDVLRKLPLVGTMFNVEEKDIIEFGEAVVSEKRKIIDELRLQVKVKKDERKFLDEMLRANIDYLQGQRSKLLKEYQDNAKMLAEYVDSDQIRITQVQELKGLIRQMEETYRDFEEKQVKIQREISDLDDRVKNQNLEKADELRDIIESRNRLLQKLVTMKEEIMSKISTDLDKVQFQLSGDITKYDKKLHSMDEVLKKYNEEKSNLQKEANRAKDELKKYKTENELLKVQQRQMMIKYTDPKSFQRQLFDNFLDLEKKLRKQIQEQEVKLQTYENEKIKETDTVKSAADKLVSPGLQGELNAKQKEITNLKSKTKELEAEVKRKTDEMEELKKKPAELVGEKCDNIKADLANKTKELNDLQAILKKTQAELDALKPKGDTEAVKDDCAKLLADKDAIITGLNEERTNLEKEIKRLEALATNAYSKVKAGLSPDQMAATAILKKAKDPKFYMLERLIFEDGRALDFEEKDQLAIEFEAIAIVPPGPVPPPPVIPTGPVPPPPVIPPGPVPVLPVKSTGLSGQAGLSNPMQCATLSKSKIDKIDTRITIHTTPPIELEPGSPEQSVVENNNNSGANFASMLWTIWTKSEGESLATMYNSYEDKDKDKDQFKEFFADKDRENKDIKSKIDDFIDNYDATNGLPFNILFITIDPSTKIGTFNKYLSRSDSITLNSAKKTIFIVYNQLGRDPETTHKFTVLRSVKTDKRPSTFFFRCTEQITQRIIAEFGTDIITNSTNTDTYIKKFNTFSDEFKDVSIEEIATSFVNTIDSINFRNHKQHFIGSLRIIQVSSKLNDRPKQIVQQILSSIKEDDSDRLNLSRYLLTADDLKITTQNNIPMLDPKTLISRNIKIDFFRNVTKPNKIHSESSKTMPKINYRISHKIKEDQDPNAKKPYKYTQIFAISDIHSDIRKFAQVLQQAKIISFEDTIDLFDEKYNVHDDGTYRANLVQIQTIKTDCKYNDNEKKLKRLNEKPNKTDEETKEIINLSSQITDCDTKTEPMIKSNSTIYKNIEKKINDLHNVMIKLITNTNWITEDTLLLINGDLIDPCTKGSNRTLPQIFDVYLHAFIYNLRIKAIEKNSMIVFTIGNHDLNAISIQSPLCESDKVEDPNDMKKYIDRPKEQFPFFPFYYLDSKTKKYNTTIRQQVLLPFYNCSPYFFYKIKTDEKTIIFVHGGLHTYDNETKKYTRIFKNDKDMDTAQDDFDTNGFPIGKGSLSNKNSNLENLTKTKAYNKYTDADMNELIELIKKDYPDTLVVVGHIPNPTQGIDIRPENKPVIAFIDDKLSTVYHKDETLAQEKDRQVYMLHLRHDDTRLTPEYFNVIESFPSKK